MSAEEHRQVPKLTPKAPQQEGASHTRIPGVDLERFAAWAARELPNRPTLRGATLLSGGHSNLNVLIDFEDRRLVLRRPPLGHVMESAHNMEREHRALAALAGTEVPVPAPAHIAARADAETGVDSPFMLMEFVNAMPLGSSADNQNRTAAELRQASVDLTRILANLHLLEPAAIGLGDFGRADGYLSRQIARWSKQLEASRSRPTPDLDRLLAAMPEPPSSPAPSVVHGDFKMNNALIDFSGPSARVAAVLDWEMSTLGDPYADLAMFGIYWEMPSRHPAIAAGFETPVDFDAGYPDFNELLKVYVQQSGHPLPDMRWYRAFAAMKIGVITESLHYRHHIGAARGPGFELMAAMTEPIARIGLEALASHD